MYASHFSLPLVFVRTRSQLDVQVGSFVFNARRNSPFIFYAFFFTGRNALEDNGEAEIIAVVHDTGLPTGIGAVASIMHYYGRDHVPLGAYKGKYDANMRGWPNRSYVDDLVAHSGAKIKNYTQVPDGVVVYRNALAASPENSVMISSIGFATNLLGLLLSDPDSISNLTGVQLVVRYNSTIFLRHFHNNCIIQARRSSRYIISG